MHPLRNRVVEIVREYCGFGMWSVPASTVSHVLYGGQGDLASRVERIAVAAALRDAERAGLLRRGIEWRRMGQSKMVPGWVPADAPKEV